MTQIMCIQEQKKRVFSPWDNVCRINLTFSIAKNKYRIFVMSSVWILFSNLLNFFKKENFFQSLLGRFISIVNFNKRTDIHTDSCQFHLKQQWDLVCITWYKKHHHFDFRSFFARVFGIFFRSKFIEKVNSFFQSLKFLENIQQYNHTLMNSMNNKCYLSEPFLNVQFISSR